MAEGRGGRYVYMYMYLHTCTTLSLKTVLKYKQYHSFQKKWLYNHYTCLYGCTYMYIQGRGVGKMTKNRWEFFPYICVYSAQPPTCIVISITHLAARQNTDHTGGGEMPLWGCFLTGRAPLLPKIHLWCLLAGTNVEWSHTSVFLGGKEWQMKGSYGIWYVHVHTFPII